jgi:hypothetical protein
MLLTKYKVTSQMLKISFPLCSISICDPASRPGYQFLKMALRRVVMLGGVAEKFDSRLLIAQFLFT